MWRIICVLCKLLDVWNDIFIIVASRCQVKTVKSMVDAQNEMLNCFVGRKEQISETMSNEVELLHFEDH